MGKGVSCTCWCTGQLKQRHVEGHIAQRVSVHGISDPIVLLSDTNK